MPRSSLCSIFHRCRKGWVWTCVSDQAIVYRFDSSRGAAAAKELMGDAPDLGEDDEGNALQQKLSVDGYSGTARSSTAAAGCAAVAGDTPAASSSSRRKVFESLTSAPHAQELLELIGKLFKVEHDAADADELGTAKHLSRRKKYSAPLVVEIYAWVDGHSGADPPSYPLTTALTYLVNQREALERFLEIRKCRWTTTSPSER